MEHITNLNNVSFQSVMQNQDLFYVGTILKEFELTDPFSTTFDWMKMKSLSFAPYYYKIWEFGIVDSQLTDPAATGDIDSVKAGLDLPNCERIVVSKQSVGLTNSEIIPVPEINHQSSPAELYLKNEGGTNRKCRVYLIVSLYAEKYVPLYDNEKSLGSIIVEKEIITSAGINKIEIPLDRNNYSAVVLHQIGIIGPEASKKWPVFLSVANPGKPNLNAENPTVQIGPIQILSERKVKIPPTLLNGTNLELLVEDATGVGLECSIWVELEYFAVGDV